MMSVVISVMIGLIVLGVIIGIVWLFCEHSEIFVLIGFMLIIMVFAWYIGEFIINGLSEIIELNMGGN